MAKNLDWDRVTRKNKHKLGADMAFRREFTPTMRTFELKGPARPCGLCEFDIETGEDATWWRKDQDLMAHAGCAQRDWDRRRGR